MAGGAKNPPRRDLSLLRTALSGVEVIPLGRHLSVRACLEAMASSDLFFGVDSGMMQLAYSVGVPAFLLKYRGDELVLWKWHGDRHAIHCGGTVDFLNLARAFLGREG
jgi:ADP-heptose:LPS heptosyltransferase